MADNPIGSIVTLIVGVSVAVLVLVLVGALGGQSFQLVEADIDSIASHPVTDDSFIALSGIAVSLDNTLVQQGTLTVEDTSGELTLAGNFTINYGAGTLTLLDVDLNNTHMNASYTWGNTSVKDSVKAGIVSSFEALEQTGGYLPIIVLAVVIALVLALVLGFTQFGGNKGNSGMAL